MQQKSLSWTPNIINSISKTIQSLCLSFLIQSLQPCFPRSHKASTMSERAFKNFRGSKDQKNCPQDRKRAEQLSAKAHPSTAHQAKPQQWLLLGETTILSSKRVEVSGFAGRVLKSAGQNPWKQDTLISTIIGTSCWEAAAEGGSNHSTRNAPSTAGFVPAHTHTSTVTMTRCMYGASKHRDSSACTHAYV